jgi:hypothetical protein
MLGRPVVLRVTLQVLLVAQLAELLATFQPFSGLPWVP